ncbi:MAG: signal peptidase I [Candidatus Portnoybacteria bacterium CG03_land_8_20_14_0_80_41_10]|uniref:Signal peptidase I n=1 Tax=Candidatus Portnoybacteria bacterium CG03_land_8_20_14_0_80_41_10 TaxID=1974808 RepID=A0A2M7BU89_9BACT|nr:MAG: signal peptidase I [Candidatus Portnoybacteria bacterium CG03_land_8_20_14_0_80_41_10]
MKKAILFIWEIIKIVSISLAIIIPVRYYLIQPFFVRGASMTPNFDNGQYLVIDEIGYRLKEPQRGEVIVFKYPLDPSQYYIKRIVGLPGESVGINDGQVFIYEQDNPLGKVLDESGYLSTGVITWGETKIKLGPDEYFVLGDNRSASSDSRQWGVLNQGNIIGRVWLRAWPFDQLTVF